MEFYTVAELKKMKIKRKRLMHKDDYNATLPSFNYRIWLAKEREKNK